MHSRAVVQPFALPATRLCEKADSASATRHKRMLVLPIALLSSTHLQCCTGVLSPVHVA
jgi:hypothetical protein